MRNQMMLVKKGGRICEKFHFLTVVRFGRRGFGFGIFIFFHPHHKAGLVSVCYKHSCE